MTVHSFSLPPGPAPGGSRSNVCRTFQLCSRDTYVWLTDSRPDLVPNEISVTDRNLMEIRRHHPRQVAIRRFGSREEAGNGADWERWLGRRGDWTGMRVQAKKLDADGARYVQLNHEVGDPPRRQSDLFREAAAVAGLPAVYVLYNGETPSPLGWRRSTCVRDQEWQWGCAVASAGEVLRAGSDRVGDLAHLALPWADLVCCGAGWDLAHQARHVIEGLGDRTPSRRDVLPDHARALTARDQPGRQGPRALAGVVVVTDEPDEELL